MDGQAHIQLEPRPRYQRTRRARPLGVTSLGQANVWVGTMLVMSVISFSPLVSLRLEVAATIAVLASAFAMAATVIRNGVDLLERRSRARAMSLVSCVALVSFGLLLWFVHGTWGLTLIALGGVNVFATHVRYRVEFQPRHEWERVFE